MSQGWLANRESKAVTPWLRCQKFEKKIDDAGDGVELHKCLLRETYHRKLNKNMTKSIGIAAFGMAFGVPVVAVVFGAVALVAAGAAVGYAVGGTAGAGAGALLAAA